MERSSRTYLMSLNLCIPVLGTCLLYHLPVDGSLRSVRLAQR